MTIKELIEILQQYPEDQTIYMDDTEIWCDDGYLEIGGIEKINNENLVIKPQY